MEGRLDFDDPPSTLESVVSVECVALTKLATSASLHDATRRARNSLRHSRLRRVQTDIQILADTDQLFPDDARLRCSRKIESRVPRVEPAATGTDCRPVFLVNRALVYILRHINGTQWHIVDSSRRTVFVGTKQQAEDWLDLQDNLQRQPVRQAARLSEVLRFLLAIIGGVFSRVSWFRGSIADSASSASLNETTSEPTSATVPPSAAAEQRRGDRSPPARTAL